MESRLRNSIILPDISISTAISILDKAGTGILLVCEGDRKLKGVLTDGDIRRAILKGISLEEPCSKIASPNPMTVAPGVSPEEALHLMDHGKGFILNHMPVVNEEGKVVDLILRHDLISEERLGLSAVIMAGGYGTRLHPLTKDMPKPMLEVGDRPLLERILGQLKNEGIREVNLTTHYQAEKIVDYFGDGSAFGMKINYLNEETPLGTAGALGMMSRPKETLLVINGDILTEVDFRMMLAFHREHGADLTMAVQKYEMNVPYGVVELEDVFVQGIVEKPEFHFFVNSGIYLLEPAVFGYIQKNCHFDMTDLIRILIEKGKPVASFPIHEFWIDIGQQEDLQKARDDFKS